MYTLPWLIDKALFPEPHSNVGQSNPDRWQENPEISTYPLNCIFSRFPCSSIRFCVSITLPYLILHPPPAHSSTSTPPAANFTCLILHHIHPLGPLFSFFTPPGQPFPIGLSTYPSLAHLTIQRTIWKITTHNPKPGVNQPIKRRQIDQKPIQISFPIFKPLPNHFLIRLVGSLLIRFFRTWNPIFALPRGS